VPDPDESLIPKYEAELARLVALKGTLDLEERRFRWLPVAGLVLGVVVGVATKVGYGVLTFALSVVTFGTGLYLTRVHHMERDFHIERARKELERLKARVKARKAEAASLSEGAGGADGAEQASDASVVDSASG
jgi:hypothetical protein